MKRVSCGCAWAALVVLVSAPQLALAQASTAEMLREFADYSGARLVFQRADLPRGDYHDIMVPLSAAKQRDAAAICLGEVKKYPPGFLGAMKLQAIGIFAACASREGDGFRPYDEQLGGYRYYGIWNGESGIAGAYYSDQQLPLTFHHEIFHHVDGTQRGQTDSARFFASDDRQFAAAISGERRYAAPHISANDLAKLRRIREGYVLQDAVSDYSAKAAGEDQAETARHFMTTLADSLVQIVERPELAGSQRILHCLTQYQAATDRGPSVQWFVDVALGRGDGRASVELAAKNLPASPQASPEVLPAGPPVAAPLAVAPRADAPSVLVPPAGTPAPVGPLAPASPLAPVGPRVAPLAVTPPVADPSLAGPPLVGPVPEPIVPPAVAPASGVAPVSPIVADIISRLQHYATPGHSGWDGVAEHEGEARATLEAAAHLPRQELTPETARDLVAVSADVTQQLIRYRLQARSDDDRVYAIRGREDRNGVNWQLRNDVAELGVDAQRLALIGRNAGMPDHPALVAALVRNLRLLARYYAFIDSQWQVTGGTREVFEATRAAFLQSMPPAQVSLVSAIERAGFDELALRLPPDGTPKLLDNAVAPRLMPRLDLQARDNPYMKLIDREIADPSVRAAIRAVQPASVRFDRASGVCISPRGTILTCAHVAGELGSKLHLEFPDGREYTATCTKFSEYLDLAVMQIEGVDNLPFAPLAPAAPEVGTWVCAIGQPGGNTPDGDPTGYGAFHVSTGNIRGFKEENRVGYQMLGGVKHDAWTYWGHSGCPLFNSRGQVVALHNSWDSETAMRHGVTYEAIVYFLNKTRIDFAMAR